MLNKKEELIIPARRRLQIFFQLQLLLYYLENKRKKVSEINTVHALKKFEYFMRRKEKQSICETMFFFNQLSQFYMTELSLVKDKET